MASSKRGLPFVDFASVYRGALRCFGLVPAYLARRGVAFKNPGLVARWVLRRLGSSRLGPLAEMEQLHQPLSRCRQAPPNRPGPSPGCLQSNLESPLVGLRARGPQRTRPRVLLLDLTHLFARQPLEQPEHPPGLRQPEPFILLVLPQVWDPRQGISQWSCSPSMHISRTLHHRSL